VSCHVYPDGSQMYANGLATGVLWVDMGRWLGGLTAAYRAAPGHPDRDTGKLLVGNLGCLQL